MRMVTAASNDKILLLTNKLIRQAPNCTRSFYTPYLIHNIENDIFMCLFCVLQKVLYFPFSSRLLFWGKRAETLSKIYERFSVKLNLNKYCTLSDFICSCITVLKATQHQSIGMIKRKVSATSGGENFPCHFCSFRFICRLSKVFL